MEKQFCCTEEQNVVQTTKGKVKGYSYDGISVFKGIPYAKSRRFHAPEEVEAWDGIFDATSFGYVCPLLELGKPNGELQVPHRYWVMNEDCQNLNVWTPACDDKKRPVMVWFHGGGFESGSAIEHIAYEGENMSRFGDVVTVTVNHRLNVLGYLDLSDFGEEYEDSGNHGTNDLIMSLHWVKDNIAAFGGDPENVTVFGQSGGGAKVTTLLQTPAADGLFAKGINMSGVIGPMLSDAKGSGKELVEALMAELGISNVHELETIAYDRLAAAYKKLKPEFQKRGKYVGCAPQPNAHYVGEPCENGFRIETAHVPLMVGSVFAEFTGFGLRNREAMKAMPEEAQEAMLKERIGEEGVKKLIPLFKKAYPERPLCDLIGLDFIFRGPEIDYVEKRAAVNEHTYVYLFNQNLPLNGSSLPWHCADVPFFFHNCELVPMTQMEGVTEKLEEQIFSAAMAFARGGNPNNPSIPRWAASTPGHQQVMIFDENTRCLENYDVELVREHAKYGAPMLMAMMAALKGEIQH